MAEELLDGAQVGTRREEMRRERVPERVGRRVPLDGGGRERAVEDAPDAPVGETPAARVEEHHPRVARGRHELLALLEPGAESGRRRKAEGNDALFSSLAEAVEKPALAIEIVHC